jgi:hypothetical protein
MSLENVVYNFAVWLEENAASDAAVKEAVVHADTYEEMNESGGTKFIRVDDLIGSKPLPAGDGNLREFNAVLDVQFLQIPLDQTLDNRLLARRTSSAMALEFIAAVYEFRDLRSENHEVCNATAQKMNGWRKVGNVKTPISIVRLTMNQDL